MTSAYSNRSCSFCSPSSGSRFTRTKKVLKIHGLSPALRSMTNDWGWPLIFNEHLYIPRRRSDCVTESCISYFGGGERLLCPKASSAWRPLTFKPDNWVDFPFYDNHVVELQTTELITSTLPLLDCHLDHQRSSFLLDIYKLFLSFSPLPDFLSKFQARLSAFDDALEESSQKSDQSIKPPSKTASSFSRSQMNTKKPNCRSIKLELGVNQIAKAERRKSVDKNKIYGWGSLPEIICLLANIALERWGGWGGGKALETCLPQHVCMLQSTGKLSKSANFTSMAGDDTNSPPTWERFN